MAGIVTTDEPSAQQLRQLEALLQAVEANPDPAAAAQTRQIVQTLMDFHGAAIGRICQHLAEAGEPGQAILQALRGDALVASVLLLYGLHPEDLRSRVAGALEQVQPSVRAAGGEVTLVAIGDDGAVRLRLGGQRHGCASSRTALKRSIEETVYAVAPDVSTIEIEEDAEEPAATGFVPLTLRGRGNR
jgi:Fe-S cluster biogenesis protein NfuA